MQKRGLSYRERREVVARALERCRPRSGDDGPLPARILRRPAPAHRHRPRHGPRAAIRRARRADLGARHVRAGADRRAAARPAEAPPPRLHVHQPRPEGRAGAREPRHRHAERPGRRGGAGGGDFRRAADGLHARAVRGRLRSGSCRRRRSSANSLASIMHRHESSRRPVTSRHARRRLATAEEPLDAPRPPHRPRFRRHRRRRGCGRLRRCGRRHGRPHRGGLRCRPRRPAGLAPGAARPAQPRRPRPRPRLPKPRPGGAAQPCSPAGALRGAWGYGVETSKGKDTPSGHWEIAGVPVAFDWGYFPDTQPAFPAALTRR